MLKDYITRISTTYPKTVITICTIITIIFLFSIPKIKIDTDPVHMLPEDNNAVVLYNNIKKEFNLSDFIVLGIESKDSKSLFNDENLRKLDLIHREILQIKYYKEKTLLNNALSILGLGEDNSKDKELIVKEDVISISSADDISKSYNGELVVSPIMETIPKTDDESRLVLEKINNNPILRNKLTSKDGSLVSFFIPLKEGKKEYSFFIGREVRKIVNKYFGENENIYIAGLPLAESTFGNEMFIQMAVYAPMAGLVVFLLMLFFFKNLRMVISPMIIGIMAVIWSMGALIYSGNVIHIMSSMIPIFILPIAVLDSVHFLSVLSERIKISKNRQVAIKETMNELFSPMLFTSITTIVGFSSLASTGIPPVIVFGIAVAFGVLISWLLTIVFIPSFMMILSEESIISFSNVKPNFFVTFVIDNAKKLVIKFPKSIIVVSIITILISIFGIIKIEVNDNPVRWFKKKHELRTADIAMNKKLAGTYIANLKFTIPKTNEGIQDIEADDFAEIEESSYPSIRDPKVIKYISKIQDYLNNLKDENGEKIVGDTVSIIDLLKRVGNVAFGSNEIPNSKEKISQYMFLFESGDIKRGKDMWKLITPNESLSSQMWVYLKSGDNQLVNKVMSKLDIFMKDNPPFVFKTENGKDVRLKVEWSGLVHVNSIWQNEMVSGMAKALTGSFIIVFIIMTLLFRSSIWALIAMLPLSITIMSIYGLIGFSGKFYDMPIAVLSSLTLGLSVDFAIHFIAHTKMYIEKYQDSSKVFDALFNGTIQAIWKNVLVIAIGFCPLFFAGLVPYITVGSFFFLIMLVSGSTTILLMPAILRVFYKYLPWAKQYSK